MAKYRFRLLAGRHIEQVQVRRPTAAEVKAARDLGSGSDPFATVCQDRWYRPGDVFETDIDLLSLPNNAAKYERVEEAPIEGKKTKAS
jgi:hypothetical protein